MSEIPKQPNGETPKKPSSLQVVSPDAPLRGAMAADPPLHPTDEFLAELAADSAKPVSYTHLTLPTIYSV